MLSCINTFSQHQFSRFIDSFDVVVTDCDEVLWIGNDPLPRSVDVMNHFRMIGKRTFFVTNNSTSTRENVLKKMIRLGFDVALKDVLNAAYLAALYVKRLNLPQDSKVYVLGSRAIEQELQLFGIESVGAGPDVLSVDLFSLADSTVMDPTVRAVIAGFDPHFSFPKLLKASTYLTDPNVHFIATNPDKRSYVDNVVVPGAGSMSHSLATSSGREPVVVGKPGEFLRHTIVDKWALDPRRTLMIGDTSYTDILFGNLSGFKTLLVLTGVTSLNEVLEYQEDEDKARLVPNYYVNALGDLFNLFRRMPRSTFE